jgi:hypothetical protein
MSNKWYLSFDATFLVWWLIGVCMVAWKWKRLIHNGLPKEGRVPVALGCTLLWPYVAIAILLDWLVERKERARHESDYGDDEETDDG